MKLESIKLGFPAINTSYVFSVHNMREKLERRTCKNCELTWRSTEMGDPLSVQKVCSSRPKGYGLYMLFLTGSDGAIMSHMVMMERLRMVSPLGDQP